MLRVQLLLTDMESPPSFTVFWRGSVDGSLPEGSPRLHQEEVPLWQEHAPAAPAGADQGAGGSVSDASPFLGIKQTHPPMDSDCCLDLCCSAEQWVLKAQANHIFTFSGFSQIHFSACLATVADYFCLSSYHCSKQNGRERWWPNMKIPLEKHTSHVISIVLSHSDMLSHPPNSWPCCLCSGFLGKVPVVPAHKWMGGFLQLMQLQQSQICVVTIATGTPFQDLT